MKKSIGIFIGLLFIYNPILCMQLRDITKIFSIQNIKKRFQKSPAEIQRLRYIEQACEQFNWNNIEPADQEQFKSTSRAYVAHQILSLHMKILPITCISLLCGLTGPYNTNNNIKNMFYSATLLGFSYVLAKNLHAYILYGEPLRVLHNKTSSPAEKSKACSKFLYYNLTNAQAPMTPFPADNVNNVEFISFKNANKDNIFYSILGVSPTATQDEIKKAHRILARKYHPDHNHNNKNAEAKFKDVSEAYEALSNKNNKKMNFSWKLIHMPIYYSEILTGEYNNKFSLFEEHKNV